MLATLIMSNIIVQKCTVYFMPFFLDMHAYTVGVLLYGAPGTGKTLLARACAAQTKVQYLRHTAVHCSCMHGIAHDQRQVEACSQSLRRL